MHFFFLSARVTSEKFCYLLKSNQGPELHYAHLSDDVKFNCIDSWSFYCYLTADEGQDYFSSYDTDKSATRRGGGEGEP